MKVYNAKGRQTPELKKMISEVSKKIEQLRESGKDVSGFKTANSPEELKSLYRQYCIDDATIISETNNKNSVSETENSGETSTSNEPIAKDDSELFDEQGNSKSQKPEFIDPLNDAPVIERDYTRPAQVNTEDIAEPNGTNDFEIPDDFEMPTSSGEPAATTNGNGQAFNDNLKDLDEGQKRKAFKRTAKAIVMAYKQFSGKPFEYIATKDISEAKMVEYHTTGELDTNLMLELPQDEHLTVRQFFEQHCLAADGMFKLDPEIETEIEEALTDVLMEKQIALTPMQRLGFYVVQDLGAKVIALVQFKSNITQTLEFLKAQHAETKAKEEEPKAEVKTDSKQESKDGTITIIDEGK
jgi:hypothetical protein